MDTATARKRRKRLSRELLKANVNWSKGVLAYRLLYMFAPVTLSKRLARHFTKIQTFPGLDVPGMPKPEPGQIIIPTPPAEPYLDEGEPPFIVIPPPGWTIGPWTSHRYSPPLVGPAPWEPGPPHRPSPTPPGGGPVKIVGNTTDGPIHLFGDNWQTIHDAETGEQANPTTPGHEMGIASTDVSGFRVIIRSFFEFDLSSIPVDAVITSAKVVLTLWTCVENSICLQESTFTAPLTVEDYNAFTGEALAVAAVNLPFEAGKTPTDFELNAAGLTLVGSKAGGLLQLCARLHHYDFSNNQPTDMIKQAGCDYADREEPENRPYIEITY